MAAGRDGQRICATQAHVIRDIWQAHWAEFHNRKDGERGQPAQLTSGSHGQPPSRCTCHLHRIMGAFSHMIMTEDRNFWKDQKRGASSRELTKQSKCFIIQANNMSRVVYAGYSERL